MRGGRIATDRIGARWRHSVLEVEQIVKVVADPVITEITIALVGIVHQIVVMNHIHAKLETVFSLVPVKDVADLPFALVGIGRAVGVIGRSGIEGVVISRRNVRNIAGASRHICLRIVGVRLLAFPVQLAAILEKNFVTDVIGDQAGELGYAVIELNEVIALGVA